mmetsp:Transcript_16949/g.25570  ORF Transcript_16949/g.25570 Transcript_16949/m.25570 type:complete len:410 (+) Transcript_16949:64-1293(+)|eukprot:CAMPEP_0185019358 /NCGR_PEP_ID=MMETSP1103-20130426/1971_1 /TAXON_ID=36769 /ORGANISM="Paraphysomonas bandaiensis, Strain Caron Lab Isolate" /LENGTH=409 /DNA_ID=CAMNT_0027549631 /DNA_START=61 /DNA_END=1290 /DNA_ORIENTATION=-
MLTWTEHHPGNVNQWNSDDIYEITETNQSRRSSSCPSIDIYPLQYNDRGNQHTDERRRSWTSFDRMNDSPSHPSIHTIQSLIDTSEDDCSIYHMLSDRGSLSTASSPDRNEMFTYQSNDCAEENLFILPDVYEVHFKRTKDMFVCESLNGSSPTFRIGDFVKVEADRGHDLGVVSKIVSPSNRSSYPYHDIPVRRVLALASAKEKTFLLSKVEDEWRALDICREFAARRRMKIKVLDAEFQFDRRKLTFLFTAEKHTDFRELVRDLFSLFKTRIWMQKINAAQAAALEFSDNKPPFSYSQLHSSPSSRTTEFKQLHEGKLQQDLLEDNDGSHSQCNQNMNIYSHGTPTVLKRNMHISNFETTSVRKVTSIDYKSERAGNSPWYPPLAIPTYHTAVDNTVAPVQEDYIGL